MLMVRILNGQQAGTMFQLKAGANVIGRAPNCDIKILNPSISKEHATIEIYDNKVIVSDAGSRNGTFVNGVQIKKHRLQPGDKISLHETVIEIFEAPAHTAMPHPSAPVYSQPHQQGLHQTPPASYGNVAYQQDVAQPEDYYQPLGDSGYEETEQVGASEPKVQLIADLKKLIKQYVDDVVLPGVYKVGELLEFKWVLALFMAGFILFVTSLSSIPLMTILKDSIQQESTNRALTIARTLSQFNISPLMDGMESALSVDLALREPGVEEAYIISNVDGSTLSPAAKSGQYLEYPFVHEARKLGHEATKQTDNDTIIAMVPIEFYNPETGAQSVMAYSVVIYNMGSLAIDNGKTFSLFIQTFFIALIVGFIFFFFLYKLIEHPIRTANSQLDAALKDGHGDLNIKFQFSAFQDLCSNIMSALSRIGGASDSDQPMAFEADRNIEMTNIIELIGFPALAVSAHDNIISAINHAFEERVGLNGSDLLHANVESINDQALKLNVQDLLERVSQQPDQMATNELEFSGENYQVAAQAVYGTQSVAYFLIVLLPVMEGGDS